ncbi:MAG: cell envelope integrity protein CreD [Spirochaetales bacterium]|nr:cell envelope integrity protein CreD [Spirochaetales bacterium]
MENDTPTKDLPIMLKILILGGMALTLLIPLFFIQALVKERSDTKKEAESEIIRSWGGVQAVPGPMISVPYRENGRLLYMLFMPDTLSITGKVEPRILHRGIYEAAVYDADLVLKGEFSKPSFDGLAVRPGDVRWDLARIIVGLRSPLGLRDKAEGTIDGAPVAFKAEREHPGVYDFTLGAPLHLARPAGTPIIFSLSLKLKGGRSLSFIPIAENTTVSLASSWTDPSFFGPPLPTAREITAAGFTASWELIQYRAAPERIGPDALRAGLREPDWREEARMPAPNLGDGKHFGVEFMIPVDAYVKSDRSAKYGILFLLVPFIALLLFELFAKVRVHLVQYLLIAVANVVFYLLLISLSEHVSFDPAYLIASALTVLVTAIYAAAFLKTAVRTIGFSAILALFYVFLFLILLSQDYALLVGALGIFAVLALFMLATRRIDWYALRRKKPAPSAVPPSGPPAIDRKP